ncbi:MAG: FHA domain-containing protein, partial [bacterium]
LQLYHPCVSRRHCCIVLADNDLYIRDLGSRHGVWVNGERVSERKLAHHDQFAIGVSFFRVLIPAENEREEDKPGLVAKPLSAIDSSILTDLETIPPIPLPQVKPEDKPSHVNPGLPEVLVQSEVASVSDEFVMVDESPSGHDLPDIMEDLQAMGPDGSDSGYEPVFDLKL